MKKENNLVPFYSPLRYPGGKRKLAKYVKLIFHDNNLLDGEYAEPYAGGAGVALSLLFSEYVRQIHINDLDRSIFSFWHSVLNKTEELCQLINDTPVTMDIWYQQQKVQEETDIPLLELGFSTFFLNRTNRSGIIPGGVIGGKEQKGKWKIDARFNKSNLIKRIQKIARYRRRINLYNLDALEFVEDVVPTLPKKSLTYFDPPYFVKGRQLLYTNFYEPEDHQEVADSISEIERNWIVSYDNAPEICELYNDFRKVEYGLSYSAQDRYRGSEVMFFCNGLTIPKVKDPSRIKKKVLQKRLI